MKCPNCQTENIADAMFCDSCGAPLQATPAAPAPAPAFVPPPAAQAPTPPAPATQPAAPLPQPIVPPTPAPPAVSAQASAEIKCPACGAMNLPNSMFCESCGSSMTAAPSKPESPSTPPPTPTPTPVATPPQVNIPTPPPVTPPSSQPESGKMIWATPASQPPPAGHPRFMLVSTGSYFDITGLKELLIGRVDPDSKIFPEIDLTAYGGDEGGVSRRHCRVTFTGNQFFVEDLGSSNGSWIGTTRLQANVRAALNNGDQLRLGKVVLNFFTGT